jgi:hypothetical protein
MALLVASAAVSLPAAAETEEETLAKREYWQDKYRVLLRNQAILKDNVTKLEHDYAQAQRRNYPRGGARNELILKATLQRQQLAQTEKEIASIFTEARTSDVPPGWLYEIEDEPIDTPRPASPDTAGEDDRAGRNPRFLDQDEDDGY